MLRKSAVICVVAFVVVAVIPAISQGQEKGKTLVSPTPTIDGDNVTQIFRIEFADVEDIASVISLFGGIVRPQPDLSVIAWTGRNLSYRQSKQLFVASTWRRFPSQTWRSRCFS
jgi:hypothetical protein